MSSRQVWGRSLVLTLLAAIALEILRAIFVSNGAIRGPLRLAMWIPHLSLLIPISWTVKRLGNRVGNFFAAVFFGAVASLLVSFFVPLLSIRPRYFAIFDTQGNQVVRRGYLYRTDDPDLRRLEVRPDEFGRSLLHRQDDLPGGYVVTENFVFWQAGFSRGYKPSALREYVPPRSFWAGVGLCLSVGALSFLELVLRALTMHFPIFLSIVLIWYGVRRSHLWFS